MKIKKLLNKQFRAKHFSRLSKRTKRIFAKPVNSTPVFLFGKQRSGTTMLMLSFELHPDTEVFDEAQKSMVYLDCRIRSFDIIQSLIKKSKAPFICFKPISDSHLISEFINLFPEGRFIWVYRDYRDVANSSLRRFNHAVHAIKLVCKDQKGGGWFQEGISTETAAILKELNFTEFSEFDWACLVWWVRNRIFIEQKLEQAPNLMTIRYEYLVTCPDETFSKLFKFIGMKDNKDSIRYIHNASIARNIYPELDPSVQKLCTSLMDKLDEVADSCCP